MRLKIVIAGLLLLATTCFSRPIKIPTYEELFKMADLVAILSVEKIDLAESVSADNPNPEFYQDYLAHCKIEHLLKGTTGTDRVVIPFFQNPCGKPGFNGAMPAPFTQAKVKLEYLAYLKKAEGNRWQAAAGAYDAALSIKSMPPVLDGKYLELPEKKVKSAP